MTVNINSNMDAANIRGQDKAAVLNNEEKLCRIKWQV